MTARFVLLAALVAAGSSGCGATDEPGPRKLTGQQAAALRATSATIVNGVNRFWVNMESCSDHPEDRSCPAESPSGICRPRSHHPPDRWRG